LIAVLGTAALALVAAGCGDDDDDDTTAAVTTTPTTTGATGATGEDGGGNTADISETDFALDPDKVTVKEGEVTFNVTNDGQAPHNLEIEGNGVEETLPQDLGPGDSGSLKLELAAGEYRMYCPVGDHAEQGMEGTVTVE
jgi:plastocyanin